MLIGKHPFLFYSQIPPANLEPLLEHRLGSIYPHTAHFHHLELPIAFASQGRRPQRYRIR